MKQLLLIPFLIISVSAIAQINWSDYATSFGKRNSNPSFGVAIPYNGIYDNFNKSIAGIAHWNPQYKIDIDTAIADQVPLFLVYDTAGIYFLLPGITLQNAAQFEFTVLLNNKTVVTPWSPVSQFVTESVGDLEVGNGITGSYHAAIGQYLVAYLRNKSGQVISSVVIYYKMETAGVKSVSTADNPLAFSNLVNNTNHFTDIPPNIGWHRQYTVSSTSEKDTLKLSYNENNLLISIDTKIYQKDALEYALYRDGKLARNWSSNEYDNPYILLKNLEPGLYQLRIRLRRQRESIRDLHFIIPSLWYQTAAFRAAVVFFLFLTAILFIAFFKYRHQQKTVIQLRQKAEQVSGELKNIHALLNPHFTFNALNSIQGLVNKGNVQDASNYLSSFGALLRESLHQSKIDHIPIRKELDNLEIYTSLEQLRQPFAYTVTVDPTTDVFTLMIPPFLLQPFIENAIKHGVAKMNGIGKVELYIRVSGNTLLVTIRDNGPGFNPDALKEGYGLALSRKRIELLNQRYGEELISLQLESNSEGTSVFLSFKNWL